MRSTNLRCCAGPRRHRAGRSPYLALVLPSHSFAAALALDAAVHRTAYEPVNGRTAAGSSSSMRRSGQLLSVGGGAASTRRGGGRSRRSSLSSCASAARSAGGSAAEHAAPKPYSTSRTASAATRPVTTPVELRRPSLVFVARASWAAGCPAACCYRSARCPAQVATLSALLSASVSALLALSRLLLGRTVSKDSGRPDGGRDSKRLDERIAQSRDTQSSSARASERRGRVRERMRGRSGACVV